MSFKDRFQAFAEQGFSLLELMIAVSIIAILALLAIPSFQDRIVRPQIVEGIGLANLAKQAVSGFYANTHQLPLDNTVAGLPPADRIVANNVSSIAVRSGAIDITFGNKASGSIAGKVLTLRPAVVPEYPLVPVAWVCGYAAIPDKMTVDSSNATTVPAPLLPLECRGTGQT